MRKGQIKLLEKAEKEGFTEEQLAVLRGNQMLYTLDYYYFLLKRGVSASVINAIIKAGEGWGMHSFGFQLMECGYSLEDILTYIEKSKKLLHCDFLSITNVTAFSFTKNLLYKIRLPDFFFINLQKSVPSNNYKHHPAHNKIQPHPQRLHS